MVGGENEVVKRSDAVANALWTPQALPESVSAWSPKHFDAASAPKSGSVRSPRRFLLSKPYSCSIPKQHAVAKGLLTPQAPRGLPKKLKSKS